MMPKLSDKLSFGRTRAFFAARKRRSRDLAGRPGKHYLFTVMALCDSVLNNPKCPTDHPLRTEISGILINYRGKEAHKIDWTASTVWEDAFLCERLIVELLPVQDLEIELERRVRDIAKFDSGLSGLYRGQIIDRRNEEKGPSADEVKKNRAVLGRMIRDLHHNLNSRELKRRYAASAQTRVYLTFVASFVMFIGSLPITITAIERYNLRNSEGPGAPLLNYATGIAGFLMEVYPAGFLISIFAGFFGAAFFMLIQLEKNLANSGVSDIRDMWTWSMLILRCLVGMGAAAIFYFFFEGGIIKGEIWPELPKIGTNPSAPVPNQDFALLVVWCFLAGYSQTLVPNLLVKTEEGTGAAG